MLMPSAIHLLLSNYIFVTTFCVKYSESPKKHYCPQVVGSSKYRKKSSFLVIYLLYGTEAVRNG